ncbi:MAG: insulinase family protein [Bacteroidales bacterium]|nr:insulinase family protein [Bacteroidales bacterium]
MAMSETIPIFTLNNGIRIIHKEVHSPVSHFGVLVNAGTRDEPEDRAGLAHFTEHTLFKGTSHRTSLQVTRRIENAGGELNASTAKEETYLHASFLSSDYPRAMELLSDILFNATFPEKELDREKDVVLEEINYYRDAPYELIFDEIEEVAFSGHPLGRNILGTKKSLKQIHRNDILGFMKRHYTADHIVLSSVGNISSDTYIKYCKRFFDFPISGSSDRVRQPVSEYVPTLIRKKKNTSQAHLMLCNRAFSFYDKEREAFTLLTNLMGGPALSAQLNRVIREKLGLAYSVEANYSPFTDSGLFSVYIGCEKVMIDRCIDLVYKELSKICSKKLGTAQLHNAKKQFLGQIAITNESKLNEMLSVGRSALFFDEVETSESSFRKVEAITAEEIMEAANRIFVPDQFSTLIYSN